MAREMMYQKLKCSGPVMDELWLEMDGNWMIQVFLLTMLDGKRLMVNIQRKKWLVVLEGGYHVLIIYMIFFFKFFISEEFCSNPLFGVGNFGQFHEI